jgi:hypothetical protein
MRRLGFALVMVLSVVSVLSLLSLGLVRYLSAHLTLVGRQERLLQARAAARGGIARALSNLSQQPDWQATLGPVEQAQSYSSYGLTFEKSVSLPYCLNNGQGTGTAIGWGGRRVAPGNVLLVATGTSGSVTVRDCALVGLARTLLEDDFNSYSGAWVQSDRQQPLLLLGKYILDLGALLQIASQAGDVGWRDYRFQVRAMVTSGVGLGLLVRAQSDDFRPSGYLVQYDALDQPLEGGSFRICKLIEGSAGPTQARITRRQAGLGGLLQLDWLLNLSHSYEVTVQDNRLQLTVDQHPVLSWEDPQRTFPQGRIGIHPLLGAVLLVDSVRVQGLFQVLSRWGEPQ